MVESIQGPIGDTAANASDRSEPGPAHVELSIVVPTFNEKENVEAVVRRLHACLGDSRWEVIFVDDDSPDGTSGAVRELARYNGRVRCIQRIGRRGLASACIEGMLASAAPYLALMDGDLQHDERLLPEMLRILRRGEIDVVVGSRYVTGGGVDGLDSGRASLSRAGTRLSRLVVPSELHDPLSGFFMIRRDVLDGAVRRLTGVGFKVLLDLFASAPRPLRFEELPYVFRVRRVGTSKLDAQAGWQYVMLLIDKLIGRYVPVRFVSFVLVGGTGVVVHLLALALFHRGIALSFVVAQALATVIAMTSNFALNNVFTYADLRLRGWRWLRGWLSFAVACSIGAFANVGVATYLFATNATWLLAGFAGIAVGAVWNYAITMVYTWRAPRSFG